MHPKPRPGRCGAAAVRLLLLLVLAALFLRLAYTASLRGAFSRPRDTAAAFYSAVFRDLLAEGFLSPASRSLILGPTSGAEAAALVKLRARDTAVTSRLSNAHKVFDNGTFDFVFSCRGFMEALQPPSLAAAEDIARVLKPEGFLVIHTAHAADPYSLRSLLDLFPSSRMVRSRRLSAPDALGKVTEVVMQKEEGSAILSQMQRRDSYRTGVVPEHKRWLVSSAEPLIPEEPLKPWVTLKKNLANIKYLPAMADISFKGRYVYVDVGSRNYGSSIGGWFKKQYPKQGKKFEIYAIEADPAFHEEYSGKRGVHLVPHAAWVKNDTLDFEVNHDPDQKDEETGRGMGRIKQKGAGSDRSLSSNFQKLRGFDFAVWLKGVVSERDFVVMKMDVEGTEFVLIPRLQSTGALRLIDEIFLECHYNRWQKCCPGKRSQKYRHTYGQCMDLFSSLRKSGVLVHQWW